MNNKIACGVTSPRFILPPTSTTSGSKMKKEIVNSIRQASWGQSKRTLFPRQSSWVTRRGSREIPAPSHKRTHLAGATRPDSLSSLAVGHFSLAVKQRSLETPATIEYPAKPLLFVRFSRTTGLTISIDVGTSGFGPFFNGGWNLSDC